MVRRSNEVLRKRYSRKMATLKNRIQTAQQRVEREQSEYRKASIDSAASFGSSILGALFGRKLASSANVGRAKSSIKSIGRAAKQRDDVKQAEKKLDNYRQQFAEMEKQFKVDRDKLAREYRPESIELESLSLKPRKSDLQVDSLQVAWMPWDVDSAGMAKPAYEI